MFKNFPKISRQISWGLFFILLLAVIWQSSFAALDPDLGWHLKFGRDIWLTRQVPHDQIHLYTINGTWVDHEWLSNLLMYLIYNISGYIGLTFIFALIATLGFWLIAKNLRLKERAGVDIFIALFLMLGLMAVLPHLGPRPQQISWLFLIIELLWLKGKPANNDWRWCFVWVIFFWLWASLHAAFFIGLVVLALWAGQKIIVGLREHRRRDVKLALSSLAGGALATLVTPYGLELYGFLTTYFTNYASLEYISEWKAIWVWPIHYWQLTFIAVVVAFTVILLFYNRRPKIAWWQWLTALMFLIMGCQAARHIPLFVGCASVLIVPEFLRLNLPALQTAAKRSPAKLVAQILLPVVLFALAWLSLISINFFNDPFQKFCDEYPCGAARLLQASPRYNQLKLFNKYAYGGWLIWVWPEKKLFIDGRLPQYPFGDHSLLEEYLTFEQTAKIASQLKAYDIEAVLWNNQLPQYHLNWLDKLLGFNEAAINGRTDELKKYLDNSPDWRQVFSDDASSVYVRKDKL
jgi:hypothetical protein